MNRFTALCVTTAVALAFTACNQADTREADTKAIQNDEAQWVQDFASKDADKIMAHYTDDAILMTPGSPAASGKNDIRKEISQMVATPNLSLKFQPTMVEVARSADIAYVRGTYTMTMTDPQTNQPINDHGSYVTTYRKEPDGTWKAVADIVASEVPPPAPAPEPMPAPTAHHH